MSQHVTTNKSDHFEEIKKNSYQSVWMAHWMRTDFDALHNANQTTQIASEPSEQIEQIQTLEIIKENVRGVNGTCTSGPRLLQKESSHLLSRLQEGKQITPWVDRVSQEKRCTSSSCLPKSDEISMHLLSSGSASGSGKSISEFGGRSGIMSPHFVHSNDQLPSAQIKQSVTEPFHSTNLLGRKTSTPYHRLKDPSISANLTTLSRDYHLPLHNFPSFRQLKLPSHGCSPELTRLEMFHHGYSSIRKLPPLVAKLEAHRIGANVDSIAGSSGCFPIFSNSNPSMLITGNTDVRFGKEDVIKNVRVSSNIDVNAYLSSTFPFHGQQGVKIQSLTSSTDSEGNRYHEDSKDSQGNLKNASSAETDAMDMDAFTERCHNSGVNQSSSVKALKSNTMQFSGDRPRTEMKNSHINSELPDTNLEFSSANNRIEGAGTSFSKTQSLDMDVLQAFPARTNNSISSPSLSILMKADPTVRWAKRLKSSATDTRGVGTRGFDLEEVSRNKMKRPSDKFTSEPLGVNHKGKNSKSDKSNGFEIKNGSSSKVGIERGKDLLLSQSWIQRWVRNEGGGGEKQLEALVLCEPQSSKLVLDDLQKKQFPSIAAMALMGRAMNGFQPCELQNRGPFVVWN